MLSTPATGPHPRQEFATVRTHLAGTVPRNSLPVERGDAPFGPLPEPAISVTAGVPVTMTTPFRVGVTGFAASSVTGASVCQPV